jgi:hypothetical protein
MIADCGLRNKRAEHRMSLSKTILMDVTLMTKDLHMAVFAFKSAIRNPQSAMGSL